MWDFVGIRRKVRCKMEKDKRWNYYIEILKKLRTCLKESDVSYYRALSATIVRDQRPIRRNKK